MWIPSEWMNFYKIDTIKFWNRNDCDVKYLFITTNLIDVIRLMIITGSIVQLIDTIQLRRRSSIIFETKLSVKKKFGNSDRLSLDYLIRLGENSIKQIVNRLKHFRSTLACWSDYVNWSVISKISFLENNINTFQFSKTELKTEEECRSFVIIE